MISFEMNNRILRTMSMHTALRRARYLIIVVVIFSLLAIYLAQPESIQSFLHWTFTILLIDVAYLLCCYLLWLFVAQMKIRKLLKALGDGKMVYKFNAENIENSYGEISSTFPYSLVKKCWGMGGYLYFDLVNGTTFGIPINAIGKKDQQRINEKIGR